MKDLYKLTRLLTRWLDMVDLFRYGHLPKTIWTWNKWATT